MTKEDQLKLKQVSDAFNAMPFEYRKIASNSETMVRIRDLERLKVREGSLHRELFLQN